MFDAEAKERLVEQFRACLDSAPDTPADAALEPPDLRTLLAEMAALKNEVRLQARQFKGALQQLQTRGDMLAEQNQGLVRDLERARTQAAEARAQAERGLLLGLLELRDRLQAGVDAQAAWRPPALLRLLDSGQRHARSLHEGSALTLQRLDELLAGHRVQAIAAVGQALDPQCMHAVAVEWAPQQAEGVVLRELRPGYRQGSELLRVAEVIVNKKGAAA
jgi:molecular chaperone GrpE